LLYSILTKLIVIHAFTHLFIFLSGAVFIINQRLKICYERNVSAFRNK
jgi:hypothetical protein